MRPPSSCARCRAAQHEFSRSSTSRVAASDTARRLARRPVREGNPLLAGDRDAGECPEPWLQPVEQESRWLDLVNDGFLRASGLEAT